MTVQHFALVTDGHPLRDEIVAILDSFTEANINVMLSSALVDTMQSFDMVESPMQASQVALEIGEVLEGDLTTEKCERAYGIVTAQFEAIIGEAHCVAIDRLSGQQRVDLFTISALGAPSHGFWNDWLLRELINLADRRTLPAFELWATTLNSDTAFIQGVGSCYALAMEGSASLMDTPPQLKRCESRDEEAWQCYGHMIFWLHQPQLSEEDIDERCAPLWQRLTTDLAPAAADSLYWLSRPEVDRIAEDEPVFLKMVSVFREELRGMLEWSLAHRDSLTSIFGHRGHGSLNVFQPAVTS